jgi:hypothetical protein
MSFHFSTVFFAASLFFLATTIYILFVVFITTSLHHIIAHYIIYIPHITALLHCYIVTLLHPYITKLLHHDINAPYDVLVCDFVGEICRNISSNLCLIYLRSHCMFFLSEFHFTLLSLIVYCCALLNILCFLLFYL